jgi:ribonuclease HIII
MTNNLVLFDEIYLSTKSIMERNGYDVTSLKLIDYGIQFQINKALWKGIVRIYANKKGHIKYDFSQIKEANIKVHLEQIMVNQQSSKNILKELGEKTENSNLIIPIIGTDESGKGDYFGPLVTAGVYINLMTKPLLEKLGTRDSKKLSDNQIFHIAQGIRKICANQYAIIEISPETYNDLYNKFKTEGKNLNVLLAWAHAKAIEEVLTKVDCENALSDKFADERFIINKLQEKGKKIILRQEHKAENNIAVAAASILARERFLKKLDKLSNYLDIELPKGASLQVIEQAKKVVDKYGKESLRRIAKLHFKTTKSILEA